MLLTLAVQNFIIIDDLTLDLKDGFIVLTGETGAGKSIILDALRILMGGRGSITVLKEKEIAATISAEFSINSLSDIDKASLYNSGFYDGVSDSIFIKRIIYPDGKTKSFVNGAVCNGTSLKEATSHFFEICGQHDSYGLFDEKQHIKMLDEYANLEEQKAQLYILFAELCSTKKEYERLQAIKIKSEEEKSYLEYIIEEIKNLHYIQGEEKVLEVQKKRVLASQKLQDVCHMALEKMTDSDNAILSTLHFIKKHFIKMPEYFNDSTVLLENAITTVEEVVEQTTKLLSEDSDYKSIEEIENRLFHIKNLCRKYNVEALQLGEFVREKEKELYLITNIESELYTAQQKLDQAERHYLEYATLISKKRQENALLLRAAILKQLYDVKMDKVDIEVAITTLSQEKYSKDGIDIVKFMIRTNPKSNFGSLANIASGGELSRIMMAFKIVMYHSNNIPTLIFDEIDSGISGAVSDSVGRKLVSLAQGAKQVIVVTHQPQVAVFAKTHYIVIKDFTADEVHVRVSLLEGQARLQEIARMLSGDHITIAAEEAARSLLKKAQNG